MFCKPEASASRHRDEIDHNFGCKSEPMTVEGL